MEPYRDLGTYEGLVSGFEGAQGKIVRVRYQLRDLDERFKAFTESHPYRVVSKFEPRPDEQAGDYLFLVESVSIPKREWGVLIGELIHNLRSALDQTVWAASTKPTIDTQFPIFTKRDDWNEKAAKMIATVPEDVRAIIEEAQPYHAETTGQDPRGHLLSVLNRLSNYDKHRLLHTAAMTLDGAAPGVGGSGQFGTIRGIYLTTGVLEPGDTLVRVALDNPPAQPELELYGEFSLGVAFRDTTGKDPIIDGAPVMENLLALWRAVGQLVTRIEVTVAQGEASPSKG